MADWTKTKNFVMDPKALFGMRNQLAHFLLAKVARPRDLAPFMEKFPKPLKNRLLDIASLIQDPFLASHGLQILKWEDFAVDLRLPNFLLNRDSRSQPHIAAITALAEHTTKLFWERHLDPKLTKILVQDASVQILDHNYSSLRSHFGMKDSDLEAAMHRLRVEGVLSLQLEVPIFDQNEQIVARSSIGWRIEHQTTLGKS